VRDVLEVSLERRQEAHVVLGLHEERAEVLTQVLERVVDAAVDVHEALDSRCLELLVQRAERSAPFAPVVDLRQRTVALTPRAIKINDKIGYDTRCYFNERSIADMSQLNLPHGDDN